MFFVGDTPWHGFGQKLDAPATAEEAIQAAHLDWDVGLESVHTSDGTIQEPHRFVRRLDNQKILGLRTSRYSVVQNRDAFGLFDAVIGPGQGVYHTAGALRGGRMVWILAKVGDTREVVSGDEVEPYILLSTSHDGSLPLQMRPTLVRVVCANTLNYAMRRRDFSDTVTIRHTGNVASKAVEVRKALGLTKVYFDRMMEGVEELVSKPMNESGMENFARSLYPTRQDGSSHRYTEEAIAKLGELFVVGRGQELPGVRGTAWAAYNAVTEFVDYFERVGHGDIGQPTDERLAKAWFGKGRDRKIDAWRRLQTFAGSANREYPEPQRRDVVLA
jgi:phage/plasmid-like protein (TIGR03299 family)